MTDDSSWEEPHLFDPGPATLAEIETRALERPVWSEHKADLITRYLRYFVFITRHGTYIDAFAGPQTEQSEQAWTAQMVLESEPKWLRHFHLFDSSPTQLEHLHRLATEHNDRDVRVYAGDSNRELRTVLPEGAIGRREASFCLLDQRTFECEWQLCQHISRLRPGPTKVEQFYFLATGWLSRSLAAVKTAEGEQRVKSWLGEDSYDSFSDLDTYGRVETFIAKFRGELGYRSVKAWPIYKEEGGHGVVMYYMIHATDHEEAPKLMYRAYRQAVRPPETLEQLEFAIGDITLGYETMDT